MTTDTTRPLQPLHYRAPIGATLASAIAAALIGILIASSAALTALHMADAQYFPVSSNSMVPAFERGDLVITRAVQALRIGDTITFRKYGQLVTHRVIALGREPGTFETRGDANTASDPWTITQADVVGRVQTVVHRAGFPLLLMGDVRGRALVGYGIAGIVILLWWATPRATRIPPKLLHPSSGYAIS